MIFNYLLPISFKRSRAVHTLLIAFILTCMATQSCFAQKHHCHADELLAAHILETSSQKELDSYLKDMSQIVSNRDAGDIINIPVVVHVIHKGESVGSGSNLAENKILQQLDILNNDFRLKNADQSLIPPQFLSFAADTEIQFSLANKNEYGEPTDGIIRREMSNITSITHIEDVVKPQTQWNPEKYMNIWIVRMPDPSILGYAYLPIPSVLGSTNDGIVVSYLKVGNAGPSTRGRTLVHEVGHYLGLQHIWGYEEGECSEDDKVSDTPATSYPYFGCPVYPQFSCGSSDMFMNYMDYVDDNCMYMFTKGQTDIMRSILSNQRSALPNGELTHTTYAPNMEQISLYPNPCQKVLHISTPEEIEVSHYTVFDNQGKLVKTVNQEEKGKASNFQIDTNSLQNGTYWVRFGTKSGKTIAKRFICIQ